MTTSKPVPNHEARAGEPARASRARLQYAALGDTSVPEATSTPEQVIAQLREGAKHLRGLADQFTPFWVELAHQLDGIADRERQHADRCASSGALIGEPEPGEDIHLALALLRVWRTC